jgi:chemotaxis protein histidine kinase CheA
MIRRDQDRVCAIGLEHLFGQQTVIVREASEKIMAIEGVAGTTVLSDGSATVIVDLNYVASSFMKSIKVNLKELA